MGKLYPNMRIIANDEKTQTIFRNLYNRENEMKDKLSEKDFAIWVIGFHDAVRIAHKFPAVIFAFTEDKDTNEVSVVTFDLKPGEHYSVEPDEEGRQCITVSYLEEQEVK